MEHTSGTKAEDRPLPMRAQAAESCQDVIPHKKIRRDEDLQDALCATDAALWHVRSRYLPSRFQHWLDMQQGPCGPPCVRVAKREKQESESFPSVGTRERRRSREEAHRSERRSGSCGMMHLSDRKPARRKRPRSACGLDLLSLDVCTRIAAYVLNSAPGDDSFVLYCAGDDHSLMTSRTKAVLVLAQTSELQREAVERALRHTFSPKYSIRDLHSVFKRIRHVDATGQNDTAIMRILSLLQRPSLKSALVTTTSHMVAVSKGASVKELGVLLKSECSSFKFARVISTLQLLPRLKSLSLFCGSRIIENGMVPWTHVVSSCNLHNSFKRALSWHTLSKACPNLRSLHLHCTCSLTYDLSLVADAFPQLPDLTISQPPGRDLLPYLRSRESVCLEGSSTDIVCTAAEVGAPVTGIMRVNHAAGEMSLYFLMAERMLGSMVDGDTASKLAKCPNLKTLQLFLGRGAELSLPIAPICLESLSLSWDLGSQSEVADIHIRMAVDLRKARYPLPPGWLTTFSGRMRRIRHLSLFGAHIPRADVLNLLRRAGADLERLTISTLCKPSPPEHAECTFSRLLWLLDTVAMHNCQIRHFVIKEEVPVGLFPSLFFTFSKEGNTVMDFETRLKPALCRIHRNAPWLDMLSLVSSIRQYASPYLAEEVLRWQW